MAASAERIAGLVTAGAKAVRVAEGRAVSIDWVEGRGGFHYSPHSRTGVQSCFCFLSFFTGGGAISGDGVGIARCGVETAGGMAIGDVARAGTSGAGVVALPCLQQRRWGQRRFPDTSKVSAGAGKMHETVNVWRPAAGLKTTWAFRLLARHRLYSAVKSAAMTAGCCDGRVFFTACEPSPVTMLAHVGAHGEL
jgi:hypothetical protein